MECRYCQVKDERSIFFGMSQLRRHIYLPGDVSLCQLERNTGALNKAGVKPAEVPACGPCLVAVSVLSNMATTLLDKHPAPAQSVREATKELLRGEFAQVGHTERIEQLMNDAAEEFPTWATYILVSPTEIDPEPDPDGSPGGASVQNREREVRDDDSSVA